MNKDQQEFEGQTLKEAIDQACQFFKLPKEELDITILDQGSSGLFGIGAKKARIRVKIKKNNLQKRAELAHKVLTKILKAAGFALHLDTKIEKGIITINLRGEDRKFLLWQNASPLQALEYLTNKIVARREGIGAKIFLDIDNFRRRRERKIRQWAQKAAQRVRKTNQPAELRPMPAHERRLVHLSLKNFPGIRTQSEGQGKRRRVIIYPAVNIHK